jgi:hypothetical protein
VSLSRPEYSQSGIFLERRRSIRFPIERSLRYQTVNRLGKPAGLGKTINMSSSGILFNSSEALPVGTQLELTVSWPARQKEHPPLALVVCGRINRIDDSSQIALNILQYKFRPKL